MRLAVPLALVALAGAAFAAPIKLENDTQKALYAVGAQLGKSMSVFSLSADEIKFVQAGLEDAVKGKPQIEPETAQAQIQKLVADRQGKASEGEKKKGKKYIDEHAKD